MEREREKQETKRRNGGMKETNGRKKLKQLK
jgi:hypothetical protein